MAEERVVVIGAGPAGVRAAEALVKAGIRPVVIDEGRRDGGQIYRRQPIEFVRTYDKLYGSEASKAQSLHSSFQKLREHIDYRPETLAWQIEPGKIHTVRGNQTELVEFSRLIICSGATDRLFPIKGWHHAGCFSMGAAQIALKSQACSIGSKVVFVGTGPLLYLVASQYVKAGANVQAVLDTSTLFQRLKALPKLASRLTMLVNGVALMGTLLRAGVKIRTGVTPLEILGTPSAGVSGLCFRTSRNEELELNCDAVALGYHLRAESQLADLARCDFQFDEESRQWLPITDIDGRSSVAGVYLAGDGVRILGADGAEMAGRLAALAALSDLGFHAGENEMPKLRKKLQTMDRFRIGLLKAFPWPVRLASQLQDEAMVCRCESITVGQLRNAVREMGAEEVNRAKALSRVGMGRCQGRYCGHAAAEIIAAEVAIPVRQVGRVRSQGPVKPLAMAAKNFGGDQA